MDQEARDLLKDTGFASAMINCPYSIGQVFDCILEVLYRRSIIQSAYNDLRKQKQHSKYPYNPLFENPDEMLQSDIQESADPEIDQWTVSSTLLPKFVQDLRFKNSVNLSSVSSMSNLNVINISTNNLNNNNTTKIKRCVLEEKKERKRIDKIILTELADANDKSILRPWDKHDASDKEDNSDSDASSSIDNSEPLKGGGGGQELSRENSFFAKSVSYPSRKSSNPLSSNDLDIFPSSRRVVGGPLVVGGGGTTKIRTNNKVQDQSHAAVTELFSSGEMRTFIDHSPPNISELKTVGGMNKKLADESWDVLRHRRKYAGGGGGNELTRASLVSIESHNTSYLLPQRYENKSSPENKGGDSGQGKKNEQTIKTIKLCQSIGSPKTKPSTLIRMRSPALEKIQAVSGNSTVASSSPPDSASQTKFRSPLRRQRSGVDEDGKELGGEDSMCEGEWHTPPTREKAVKIVKQLASEAMADDSLYTLMELDVQQRKICVGEWVYLEQGLRRQQSGDINSAILSFTRYVRKQYFITSE